MRNRKITAIILSITIAISMMPAFAFADAEELASDIVILATSDIHAQIDGDDSLGFGGARAIQTVAKNENKYVATVDVGDAIQGSSAGYLTKGMGIVRLMNAMDYDVLVPGNHDFDYGTDYFLNTVAKELKTDYVSCNFSKVGSETPYFEPYIIKAYGDRKVAFLGITTPETLIKSKPVNFQDADGNIIYDFCGDASGKELQKRVQKYVNQARAEGADYVVALGHLGSQGGAANPWKSQDVISHTSGIDVFVDGHAHLSFNDSCKNSKGKKIPWIGVGTQLKDMAMITIEEDGDITTESVTQAPKIAIDEEFSKLITDVKAEVEKVTGEKIGNSKYDLITHDKDGNRIIRSEETNLGDFCTDAIRAYTGSDIAVINGGGIRADLKKGNITRGDILNILPFGNKICECEASGQEIWDALELGAMNVGSGENGGFLHVSGLTYRVDPYRQSTVVLDDNKNFVKLGGKHKVYDVMVGGEPLDVNKTYTLACHNFKLKSGGDGFVMFKDNHFTQDEVVLDSEVLIEYITKDLKGVIGKEYAESQGRISFLSQEEHAKYVEEELAETRAKLEIAEYEPSLKVRAGKKLAKLTWNACRAEGVSYRVYKKVKGGKYTLAAKTDSSKLTVKKLKRGKTYYFKVAAVKTIDGKTYKGHNSNVVKVKVK